MGRLGRERAADVGRLVAGRRPFVLSARPTALGRGGRPSLSSGFAVYEGMPESLLFVGIAVGTIVLVVGALGRDPSWLRPQRSRLCLLAGLGGGAALSAPLWLPGLAVLRQSSRASRERYRWATVPRAGIAPGPGL